MNSVVVQKSKTGEYLNLSADFHVVFEPINKAYQKLFSRKFKNQPKHPLSENYEVKRHVETDRECIYMGASVSGVLKFELLTKPESGRSYYTLIIPKEDSPFTAQYLLWLLNHQEVQDYLMLFTVGSIQPTIATNTLESLLIPTPKKVVKSSKEIIINSVGSAYRRLLKKYYEDYLLNFNNGSYMTAAILAGAIAEVIIYELLLESDIEERLIDGKTLGGLIRDVELLKLDQVHGFSIEPFKEIQRLRNHAVHAGLAVNKIEADPEVERQELKCLDQIIKHFGI